jgi:hypothetical protein
MAYYAAAGTVGSATMTSTYKGLVATWAPATARRIKWYEFVVGAISNPNATDTYIQVDISRLSGTTSLAGAAVTPAPLDPADQAAATLAAGTLTTEVNSALVGTSLFNTGINQRATTRWIAAQESQYLITPATAANGLELRMKSGTYAADADAQVSFTE